MKGLHTTLALSLAMLLGAAAVQAEDYVYGRELMTEQELAEHQATMRSLKTEEAREAYRMAHHEKMQERAQAQGVKLPDEAPAAGRRGDGPGRGYDDDAGHKGRMDNDMDRRMDRDRMDKGMR